MPKVTIKRTEQWEYTAYGYGEEGKGSSEISAELNLLRKVVAKKVKNFQEEKKKFIAYWSAFHFMNEDQIKMFKKDVNKLIKAVKD